MNLEARIIKWGAKTSFEPRRQLITTTQNRYPKLRIAIVGFGYAGLFLAAEFVTVYLTVGLDINKDSTDELKKDHNHALEGTDANLEAVTVEATKYSSQQDGIAPMQAPIFRNATCLFLRPRPT